jgi:23S rRNA (pseudouridine1915-N3)-methyltransferase
MRLHLVFVGKTGFHDLDSSIRRYMDRLVHYIPTEIHLIKAEKIASASGSVEDAVKEREGERILKLPGKQDHLAVWDQRGRQLDSTSLAHFLEDLMNKGVSHLWMVTGGPLGISPKVIERADSLLSLSKMTFPHDLARLMVGEQLYRAFTILKGEPYHR